MKAYEIFGTKNESLYYKRLGTTALDWTEHSWMKKMKRR